MDQEVLSKLGKKAFVQSLKPYHGGFHESVAIFGLDTEYVPHVDKASDLICWQLASEDQVALVSNKKLTLENLFKQAKALVHQRSYKFYIFVCYFSLAEIQFFNLDEWIVNEFKGKYRLTQVYGDGNVQVLDLANWYPKQPLEKVAKLWGEHKESDELLAVVERWGLNRKRSEAPIGTLVQSIERGEHTKRQLLNEPEFRSYAKSDPVIVQRIFSRIRRYFLDTFEVDILATMTPANTSASIFRKGLEKVIDQRDANLREMALKCCWGGRMEAMYRGQMENVYEYDATGHHPNSARALGILPTGLDWLRTSALNKWLSGVSGFGKVHFRFDSSEKYPCLPVFDGNALLYPLEGVSFCSVSEAKLAVECGAKLVLFDGYYYKVGTDVLQRYLADLQQRRDATKDPSEREQLKLLSNSVIGKLFQKSVGVDIAKVQAYAEENGLPVEEAIKIKGVDFGTGEVKVGSCFYPEWYALILGKARATISRQAREHLAVMVSSDSFVTAEFLGEEFDAEKIHYSVKAKGELISYRTRFYRVGTKLAHHAIHITRDTSGEEDDEGEDVPKDVLSTFIPDGQFEYLYYRFTHLKEAWRHHKAFGSRVARPMTASLGFDYKRQLDGDSGWSRPWRTIEDRRIFLAEQKELKRKR